MRLLLDQPVPGLQAEVQIDRGDGRLESLALRLKGTDGVLESDAAPEEPHELDAALVLDLSGHRTLLPFRMVEPEGHPH